MSADATFGSSISLFHQINFWSFNKCQEKWKKDPSIFADKTILSHHFKTIETLQIDTLRTFEHQYLYKSLRDEFVDWNITYYYNIRIQWIGYLIKYFSRKNETAVKPFWRWVKIFFDITNTKNICLMKKKVERTNESNI